MDVRKEEWNKLGCVPILWEYWEMPWYLGICLGYTLIADPAGWCNLLVYTCNLLVVKCNLLEGACDMLNTRYVL